MRSPGDVLVIQGLSQAQLIYLTQNYLKLKSYRINNLEYPDEISEKYFILAYFRKLIMKLVLNVRYDYFL